MVELNMPVLIYFRLLNLTLDIEHFILSIVKKLKVIPVNTLCLSRDSIEF